MAIRDPRRTVNWLGAAGAGLLFATLAGTAAANYVVSGVDPFYFSGVGLRAPLATPDRSIETDDTPQTTTTFPSMSGDQYYWYRPPAVTASYDAASIGPEPAVDRAKTAEPTDRDATNEGMNDPQVVEDRSMQPRSDLSPSNDEQSTEANASIEQGGLGSDQEAR